MSSKGVSIPLFIGSLVTTAVTTATVVYWYHRGRKIFSSGGLDKEDDCAKNSTPTPVVPVVIRPPLRHTTPKDGEESRIVYLTGIDKQTTQDELIELFSCCMTNPSSSSSTLTSSLFGMPMELDLSEVAFAKSGGRAWAMYKSSDEARRVVTMLHQKQFRGCILCARLELGVRKDGVRIVDVSSHTALVRGIQTRRGTPQQQQQLQKGKKNKYKMKNRRTDDINQTILPRQNDFDPCGGLLCQEITQSHGGGNPHVPVTYSHRSISVGQTEYPFPSGLYLTKLIQISSAFRRKTSQQCDNRRCGNQGYDWQESDSDRRMLDLLSDVTKLGNGSIHKYTKEISEAMAMVDALQRAIKIVFGVPPDHLASEKSFDSIRCYCLGDGTYPVSAAALATFLWTEHDEKTKKTHTDRAKGGDWMEARRRWAFVSIDPILKFNEDTTSTDSVPWIAESNHRMLYDRIECFRGYSQEYIIDARSDRRHEFSAQPASSSNIYTAHERHQNPKVLSIAIACHSHAPLKEFWDRMPNPKLCIAMPCCAQYSEIPDETPILTYDDYEVYSPKRRIKIFASVTR